MVMVALGAGTALVVVLFAVLALATGQAIWWLAVVIYLVLSLPADWVLWRAVQPPVLKSDGTTVNYKSGFRSLSIAVADLGVVYLGRYAVRGGYSAGVKSYVFAGQHGKVTFATPAMWFRDEDMRAFAERLNVPMRGDFSQRVTNSVPA